MKIEKFVPISQSHPVQIVKNKAGAIREVRLYLEDEEFTVHNDFIQKMTRLPSLEKLIIVQSKIDNDGLRSIRKMSSLKMLAIQNSPITDRGLRHLVGLANLEQVGFYQTGVTYEYVRKFHEQIPHIEFLDCWCCGCMSFDPITRQSARD
ncbi:MAG: hypothetical protein ACKVT0_02315 [Planctomycetaceae bacterium]